VRRRLPPALQQRDFTLLWTALVVMGFAGQMAIVAIGWQVYAIDHDPLDLGLIGLAEFLPLLLLALPAGHVADRFPRRLVFGLSLVIEFCVLVALVGVSRAGAHELWPFLVLAVATGVAGSLGAPTGRALPTEVVVPDLLASAMALRSIAGQAAVIGGPVIGGVLFAIRPELVYGVAAAMMLVGLGCLLAMGPPIVERERIEEAPGLERLLAGVGGDLEAYYRKTLQPLKLAGYVEYLRRRTWKTDLVVIWDTLRALTLPSRARPPAGSSNRP